MTKRMIVPLLFGLVGCAILLSLGTWQMKRLSWKQEILAEIDSKIIEVPVLLPEVVTPEEHKYLSVEIGGDFTGDEIHVLMSLKNQGAGYRIISAFGTSDGRRVMVDRGFVPTTRKNEDRAAERRKVQGNLHWPEETDSYTPAPDLAKNIWFARDVAKMAEVLQTEPVLVVARVTSKTTPSVQPTPVSSTGIPNDHLQYAITWFLLATAWAGMTLYLLWRIRHRTA